MGRSSRIPRAIVYYGGWTLSELRASTVGKWFLRDEAFYEEPHWADELGYYRLLLPVPDSTAKTWDEQDAQLQAERNHWKPAPLVVALTPLLAHLVATGRDLFRGKFCRCASWLL
jgi:hypothetical protein